MIFLLFDCTLLYKLLTFLVRVKNFLSYTCCKCTPSYLCNVCIICAYTLLPVFTRSSYLQVNVMFHFCHPLASFTFYCPSIYSFNLLLNTIRWCAYIITISTYSLLCTSCAWITLWTSLLVLAGSSSIKDRLLFLFILAGEKGILYSGGSYGFHVKIQEIWGELAINILFLENIFYMKIHIFCMS